MVDPISAEDFVNLSPIAQQAYHLLGVDPFGVEEYKAIALLALQEPSESQREWIWRSLEQAVRNIQGITENA